MKAMSTDRARRLLGAMQGRPVLVVGDVMLDEFLWGRVARISPEAPVPVVEVTRESARLGGAGNVSQNVRALGGEARLVGVVGADAGGRRVRDALQAAGIRADLVEAPDGRPTTVKMRIIAHQQQVVRADREQSEPVSPQIEEALLAKVREALPGCRAAVVSDYDKGVVTPRVMSGLLRLARRRRVPVLVDPKIQHFRIYRGARVVTPNQNEAELATGIRIRSDADLLAAGTRILALVRCEAALVTRGERGMSLFAKGHRPVHIPTAAREVFDVTGAGDTVIAGLGLAVAAGARLTEAAELANHAAGVVVGKLGTASATPGEVLETLRLRP